MQNADVARIFDQLADLLEIQEANPFRVRAYRNAARTIGNLSEAVADILADPQRDLDDLPGIGKDLAGKIKTIIETNSLPQLEELRKQIPARRGGHAGSAGHRPEKSGRPLQRA